MPAGTPIQVRLPDEERDMLDAFRRQQQNPPSRAQAAREFIRRGVMAALERDAFLADRHSDRTGVA